MTTKNLKATIKRGNTVVHQRGVANTTPSLVKYFALEIRVRGKTDYLHRKVCSGLEDALRIGQKWFKAFQARNPWFVQDSKRKRIFVLLDPETEGPVRS